MVVIRGKFGRKDVIARDARGIMADEGLEAFVIGPYIGGMVIRIEKLTRDAR